jgi:hypothetical protein
MLGDHVLKLVTVTIAIGVMVGTASAQAIPNAPVPHQVEVGTNFVFCYPDYSPQKALGFGLFVDYDFNRHLAIALDYHHSYILQHYDKETVYEVGPLYRVTRGSFSPYLKGAVGRGIYDFAAGEQANPLEGFTASQGNNSSGFTTLSFAGGLDAAVSHHLNLRAEAEYQRWFSGTNLGNGLTPILYTVGFAYQFNKGGTK